MYVNCDSSQVSEEKFEDDSIFNIVTRKRNLEKNPTKLL